jgi:hypothetical protein
LGAQKMNFQDVIQTTQARKTFTIRQSRLWVVCGFWLPDNLAENMPAIELAKVRGNYLLGFNFKPEEGEYIPYLGHIWQILNQPIQFPTRYKASGQKNTPFVMTEYVESYSNDSEIIPAILRLLS